MSYNTDFKYFKKAKQVADISDFYKTHVGCIAVYKGIVIGIGCNTEKTTQHKNIIIDIEKRKVKTIITSVTNSMQK